MVDLRRALGVLLAGIAVAACGSVAASPQPTATASATASATPTAAPTATATAAATVANDTVPHPLQPGTYTAGDPFQVRLTFAVPAGWEGNVGGPYAVFLDRPDGNGAIRFTFSQLLYADPCHPDKGLASPQPGPSVADLASALERLSGFHASTPTDVTLGGFQGKQLTLTAPAASASCPPGEGGRYPIWRLPLGAFNDLAPGGSDRLWILDAGGQPLVIDSPVSGPTAATQAEVQGILDSLHIAPATTGASPTSS